MNGAPTLLVVDDEASNLESLERIFAREGLTVLARQGRQGRRSSSCASGASTCCSPTS